MAEPGLRKFIRDQEEAVQLARQNVDESDPIKLDAANIALSLAHVNAVACDERQSMVVLLADADIAEKWLRGKQNA